MKPRTFLLFATALTFILVLANLAWGSVKIPLDAVIDICLGKDVEKSSWSFIVLQSRLPQAVTALLAGASLATAGLMLQTAFNNPLAGPSILGVNSGAGLGVAVVMLLLGGSIGGGGFFLSGTLAVLAGAMVGALVVLGTIIAFASVVKSNIMLLIIGIMWDISHLRPYRCSIFLRQPKGYSLIPFGDWATSREYLRHKCRFSVRRHS